MLDSKKIIDLMTVTLFAAALCLPMVDESIRPDIMRAQSVEYRVPAKPPVLPGRKAFNSEAGREFLWSAEGRSWMLSEAGLRWSTRFPKRFDAYYGDSFGYRDILIQLHASLAWHVFDWSPTSLLVRGHDDWVFTTADYELDSWRGAVPMTPAQVDAWKRCLARRRKFFAEYGIEYMLFVAPDKSQVYSERMPDWCVDGLSRFEQFHAAVATDPGGLVYPLEAIRAARVGDDVEDFVYRRLGSHWTDRGALVAANTVADALHDKWPAVVPLSVEDFELGESDLDMSDDMGARMFLPDEVLGIRSEFVYELIAEKNWHPFEGSEGRLVTRTHVAGRPSAIVTHDSFGIQVRPFLAGVLGHTEFLRTYELDLEHILSEKPDLVVQLVVERGLNFLPREVPRLLTNPELEQRFAASDESLLRIDAANEWPRVSPGENTRLALHDDRLFVEKQRGRAGFWLPEVRCPAERDLVVRVDLTVEAEDRFRICYSTRAMPEFDPRRNLEQKLEPGRNTVYLELLEPDLAGRIFVIPFNEGRKATIHSVEIRAVSY